MKLFQIELRTPTFGEFTAAAVMGIGLWLACLGMLAASGRALGVHEAGAALLVFVWAAIGARVGVHVGKGARHLVANVFVSAMLLLAYEGAWLFAA